MKKSVRTRFAPSPTGHLHIGNARTAIMNWLFARHCKGSLILRVEDTDRERSTEASEFSIKEDLKWLGLTWDEGPGAGGDYGPYHQSKRLELYRQIIRKLIESGKAYPCYCTPEELNSRRKAMLKRGESIHYDGRCRKLTEKEKKNLEESGRKPAFRLMVADGEVSFDDLVKGRIVFKRERIADFILIRPDGMPMYNFACATDDHFMEITHVIRGDDHVSNTPRQILIFKALGWEPPIFVHIPMILGKDRERLSKRHGATSVAQYRESGYLPEALVNFLSLLSWSSESGDEILPVDRLVQEFDFGRVSSAAAVFNVEKLDWMNGVYIRDLDPERLKEMAEPFLEKAGYDISSNWEIERVVSLLQDKLQKLSDIQEKAKIFFQSDIHIENGDALDVLKAPETNTIFHLFIKEMGIRKGWNKDIFREIMKSVQKRTEIKGKQLWMPVRVALTGQVHGPDLSGVVEIFGREKCRHLIETAFNLTEK